MNEVRIKASKNYSVLIGSGLLDTLGERAAQLVKGRTAVLVTDRSVNGFYGPRAKHALEQAGFRVAKCVLEPGEQTKSGENFLELLNLFAREHLTRADLLVALGGGVVGDLTGFAAACYLRGVPYVQVPTSLLAMVDSSVGGKTAIDLPSGKNLAGAFYQPSLVLCDTDCLKTLPGPILRDGCAEVIKYGILGSKPLFEALKHGPKRLNWEAVITRCVKMKRDVVQDDEFDTGRRQLLNLGHTLGHAVELGSKFELSHGQAVAVGISMIARGAVKHGFCTPETRDEIVELLKIYHLPTETDQAPEEICQTARGDKKRRGGTLTLVVPREIGKCELVPIPMESLMDWIP